ncbi:MAG: DUF4296 domain-containing protein [Bacteroidales bacterium]|nr:DUF4296 domain-containing protein [Bacteroidales bacterium]
MKRIFLHIPAVLAALLLCFACSDDESKVISRGKMAKIYAEMLVMDQWAVSDSRLRQKADTSLIYEPIFEKYGYDGEDYRASVEYYMNDPERFSRILRESADILDARIEELKNLKQDLMRQEKINRLITDFEISDFYPYLSSEPYVHYYDSLAVELDTLSTYRLVSIERADTLYDCLRMIVQTDTLKNVVKEEDAQKDSVAVEKPVRQDVLREDILGMPTLVKHSELNSLRRK